MVRTGLIILLLTMLAGLATPAMAASFDCTKASSPFEHAICDNPALSSADDVLAKAFATATGGLTKPAASAVRADQRDWLEFAVRACTDTGEPLAGDERYSAEQVDCLTMLFGNRTGKLEDSRMLGGHRFYVTSDYSAQPDPDGQADPNYYWKVATHAVSYPVMDADDELAEAFNGFLTGEAHAQALTLDEVNDADGGAATSDTDTAARITVVTPERITMEVTSYWFGHGAAHGALGLSYLHYLPAEDRALLASDIFAGAGWEEKLQAVALAQLRADHGEWLMLDDPTSIADAVIDPSRWSFDSDYGLTIQFQQYEVAPYAYGLPTITVPWEAMEGLLADSADTYRYGG